VTRPAGADRRPLAFLLLGVAALAAVAWTPLRELRGALVATEFARAIASGDSARLAVAAPATSVRGALCAYRETDVRSWPWTSGSAALRGRETLRDVEYTISVADGRSLRVFVSTGWRPVPLRINFARGAAGDTSFVRFDRCSAATRDGVPEMKIR
jgi:hypothetical protein